MITIIVCIVGMPLGFILADKLGDSREANIAKVCIIILLILFACWNEGAFG